jgi:alkanesulfonate monooxygenase SsuD/methylene tetrahydromethanopterin reductase-like flavin-dependent oxidoreductase (luciferase family)
VTSQAGGRYAFDHVRIDPPLTQDRLPIMIGGAGEKKTLRLVAQYADIWNVFGAPETVAHKDEVLRARTAPMSGAIPRRSSGRSAAR